jgi:hypothetical protein
MITENRYARRATIDAELRDLLYRRLLLEREREALEKRINYLEGALNENEAIRRDIDTDAAIQAAQVDKPAEEAVRGAEQ